MGELRGAGERVRAADPRDWQGGCWGPRIGQKVRAKRGGGQHGKSRERGKKISNQRSFSVVAFDQ